MVLNSIRRLQELIDDNYVIVKIHPQIYGSDAEINIVNINLISKEGGKNESIKAYGEESHELREYIRRNALFKDQSF